MDPREIINPKRTLRRREEEAEGDMTPRPQGDTSPKGGMSQADFTKGPKKDPRKKNPEALARLLRKHEATE